jgi:hypothetical protein
MSTTPEDQGVIYCIVLLHLVWFYFWYSFCHDFHFPKTRSCSKSNKVTVKDRRNVCKKFSKKLMFNKTVSKDKKKTDDTVSK